MRRGEKPVELPYELYERVAAAAAKHQRSIRGEVRYALTLYLDQLERRNGGAPQPTREATTA